MERYHYGVFNLNRKTEFESCEPPERFLETVEKFHEIFGLDLPDYEVWQNDGAWMPLHGVPVYSQTVLLPDVLDTTVVDKGKNAEAVGKKLLSNYRLWKREVRTIEKYGARRDSDRERLKVLNEKITQVLWLVESVKTTKKFKQIKKIELVRAFERMTKNTEKRSYYSFAQELSISVATLYRLEKRLTKALGECSIRKLTSAELDLLLRD